MDFKERLEQFAREVNARKDNVPNEESTKASLILPFFRLLGYDTENPKEVAFEYVADLGEGKSEKVDVALLYNGKADVVVECKPYRADLGKYHGQLFKYFVAARARFGILTNGVEYRFYTDLDNANLMDAAPFLVVDLLDIKESQVPELKKFCRDRFSVSAITSSAEKLKYTRSFQKTLAGELKRPSDSLVRHFLAACHSGVKTQQLVEKYRPVLKRVVDNQINEILEARMNLVIHPERSVPGGLTHPAPASSGSQIVTTGEEIEAYCLVKQALSGMVEARDISYKDTGSYFGVLYAGNTWKWICRFRFSSTSKVLILPDADKNEVKIELRDVYEIPRYADKLQEVLRRYLN